MTILAQAEQGLGDEIFFLRFAPRLRARGASVLYRGSPKIAAILARSGAVDRLLAPGEAPPGVAMTVSIADLPYMLGMASVADIPPSLTLSALPAEVAAMRARLEALGPAPYYGVTWRAGTKTKKSSLFKEAPRDAIAALFKDTPGTLLLLQRVPQAGEVAEFARVAQRPAHDLTELNDRLEEMLALLGLIDEYVCVSNTNVHLRAGLGRTCRVLLPYPPEFRWMAEGDESPWYPGTRVYRQHTDGDWGEALTALKRDLA
jgi:hypothetical protein